jgi:hypothetical protein
MGWVYGWDVNDDDVIDLTSYRGQAFPRTDREGSPNRFAVWGAEGKRSRFALPVWRAIYSVAGGRGGLVWTSQRGDAGVPEPLFVLDLASEPARTEFTPPSLAGLDAREPPTLLEQEGSVVVYLGSRDDRNWFLILDGRSPSEPLDSDAKEDLMFLAGECAGLLFFRQLADAGEEPNGK